MANEKDTQTIQPLRFIVAPHVVEDLGLNLYTSLPRVLVEFVANAYDADSKFAYVSYDSASIQSARAAMKAEFEAELDGVATKKLEITPLATRVLPETLSIEIRDEGHGMSRNDLATKFLIAGRRRRAQEPEAMGRTTGGRPLMGRKGLGKLAGFGVAKYVEVTTKRAEDKYALRIVLDYNELIARPIAEGVQIQEYVLSDDGGLGSHGTRIRLSKLLYDPLKSRPQTIQEELAEHFELISPSEFTIKFNGEPVPRAEKNHQFAWPEPKKDVAALVSETLKTETGSEIFFKYRLRFTPPGKALPATRRGVRVYAHGRLAAAPSLLATDTNMHGFRMTDYLDGVVEADFLDDAETDYIATDRQNLRWESPLLSPLWDFLSAEIRKACTEYQKVRDQESEKRVEEDPFTKKLIEEQELGTKDHRLAMQVASLLESASKKGVDDPVYKEKLPVLVRAIGHGNIVAAIATLAADESPDLRKIAGQLAKLTADELDQFLSTAKTRLKALAALKRVVTDVNFKESKEEQAIQRMLESSPWMLDATYTQFLSANEALPTLFDRLAKHLKIGKHAKTDEEKRPDLAFLIGSESLGRLVIVELKAPNLALEKKHLDQLEYYMERAEEFLSEHDKKHIQVRGQLIGSLSTSKDAEGVVLLRRAIKESGANSKWKVRDFLTVLEDTEAAHQELLSVVAKKPK